MRHSEAIGLSVNGKPSETGREERPLGLRLGCLGGTVGGSSPAVAIAEVIVYNRALPSSQNLAVRCYLSQKYNLKLKNCPHFGGAKCGSTCQNNGKCVAGTCNCARGWLGKYCTVDSGKAKCDPPCLKGRGECIAFPAVVKKSKGSTRAIGSPARHVCKCAVGYAGPACAENGTECSSAIGQQRPCLQGGVCLKGKCQCTKGYGGALCKDALCEPKCAAGQGRCVKGVCTCEKGFTGAACSMPAFLADNSAIDSEHVGGCGLPCVKGHGSCFKGKCVCKEGWHGATCLLRSRSGNSKGRLPGDRGERPGKTNKTPPKEATKEDDESTTATKQHAKASKGGKKESQPSGNKGGKKESQPSGNKGGKKESQPSGNKGDCPIGSQNKKPCSGEGLCKAPQGLCMCFPGRYGPSCDSTIPPSPGELCAQTHVFWRNFFNAIRRAVL